MNRCYSIIIYFYYYLILIASPFNRKAKKWIDGRKKWESVLLKKIKKGESWIWFHCSSLGEFEDCCEIFFQIQNAFPHKKTILTVFSPSAFEALKQTNLFDVITFLPIDTKSNAKSFVDIVNPEFALFSRSELWLNILTEVQSREIPIFLISLKLSSNSNFVKWPLKYFFGRCFKTFNYIYCQNAETQKLLHSNFNLTNSMITGNTRFERISNQSQIGQALPDIERYVLNSKVIVIGSSLPKDENFFLDIYDELKMLNIKWIIVPHEIEKSIIIKKMNTKNLILYSNIIELNKHHDILIVDSVGLLKLIYKYANLAIIGGGFDKIGIHNVIEPAVHGVQMAFGPNHKNYEEAIQLLNLEGATIYRNSNELKMWIKNKLLKPSNIPIGENIKQYVKTNTIDNSKIIESIRMKINFTN